jgi:hypothetical protein
MRPTRGDLVGTLLLFLVLSGLIAVLVFFAIPPGGAPTLQ